jgi:hypothetical protein
VRDLLLLKTKQIPHPGKTPPRFGMTVSCFFRKLLEAMNFDLQIHRQKCS